MEGGGPEGRGASSEKRAWHFFECWRQTRTDYRPPTTKPIAQKNIFPKPCKKTKSHDSILWREEIFLPGAELLEPLDFLHAQTRRGRNESGKRSKADLECFSLPRRGVLAARAGKSIKRLGKAEGRTMPDFSGRQAVARSLSVSPHYEPRNVLAPIPPLPHRNLQGPPGLFVVPEWVIGNR